MTHADWHFAEADRLRDEGYTPPQAAYFMKQTIGNACGTIGVLHALANNLSTVSIGESDFLDPTHLLRHPYDMLAAHLCSSSMIFW